MDAGDRVASVGVDEEEDDGSERGNEGSDGGQGDKIRVDDRVVPRIEKGGRMDTGVT